MIISMLKEEGQDSCLNYVAKVVEHIVSKVKTRDSFLICLNSCTTAPMPVAIYMSSIP